MINNMAQFQFGTSAMISEGLGGYGTLEYEGQVPIKLLF